jgi:hypothetical protein
MAASPLVPRRHAFRFLVVDRLPSCELSGFRTDILVETSQHLTLRLLLTTSPYNRPKFRLTEGVMKSDHRRFGDNISPNSPLKRGLHINSSRICHCPDNSHSNSLTGGFIKSDHRHTPPPFAVDSDGTWESCVAVPSHTQASRPHLLSTAMEPGT